MPISVPLYDNEVTPAFVTDEVINNLEDTIKVTELTVERRQLFVTLDSHYAPVKNCSKIRDPCVRLSGKQPFRQSFLCR